MKYISRVYPSVLNEYNWYCVIGRIGGGPKLEGGKGPRRKSQDTPSKSEDCDNGTKPESLSCGHVRPIRTRRKVHLRENRHRGVWTRYPGSICLNRGRSDEGLFPLGRRDLVPRTRPKRDPFPQSHP